MEGEINLAAAARMQLPNKDIKRKAVRTLNTSKRGATMLAILATTRIVIRHETETLRRTALPGTRTSQCINQRVPKTEMIKAMQKVARANLMVNNINRKVKSRIIISRGKSPIRSIAIVIIINRTAIIESRVDTTSSRIKTKVWDECH